MSDTPLEQLGLIDHHCHGVVTHDLSRQEFESLLNEASGPSPLGTSLFDSMLGLAVRRWCAPVLGIEPLAGADEYLAQRSALGADEVNRRFLRATSTDWFLVDTGYAPDAVTTPDDLAVLSGGQAHEIVRLESLAERLLAGGTAAPNVPEGVSEALAQTPAVAAKSIAAYRTGLELTPTKPSIDDVGGALGSCRPGTDGRYRIVDPTVSGWLAWTAIESGLPLQFHVGYGDSDVDLRLGDPLLLTGFLRATQEREVPVLLLHNYPFHRQASYLSQVFDHVFMDLGLATHNTGTLSEAVIREALELVPFAKMLYSSDAYGLAELYFLGALLFRRGLAKILDALVAAGEASAADADHISTLIGSQNARRIYRLDLSST